ncbi:TB2/DP1, HVA22 family-domain-containing protein, partial [Amylostereum chailletii]
MLLYFTTRIISSVVAFLYPGYASFKTLSQRPASEQDLERWLMYWSVLGCIVGVEYVAEWLVSWIPFYFTLKTIFLLYLALPQTRGSSYIYVTHLQPLLRTYEPQIDAALASLKTRIFAFVQERARALWDHIAASTQSGSSSAAVPPSSSSAAPPTLSDPVSGPTQMLGNLWRTYGPAIVASGTALLSQSAAASSRANEQGINTPPGGPSRMASSNSVDDRRRQLEAELAGLPVEGYDVGTSSPLRARTASNLSDTRERGTNGRFEEIEVPSDAEGDDDRSAAPRRTSGWFGWGSGPA